MYVVRIVSSQVVVDINVNAIECTNWRLRNNQKQYLKGGTVDRGSIWLHCLFL